MSTTTAQPSSGVSSSATTPISESTLCILLDDVYAQIAALDTRIEDLTAENDSLRDQLTLLQERGAS